MNFSKLKLSVLLSVVAVLAIFICVSMVRADTGSNMYGYAWSSNIGWIKLNDCDDPSNSGTCNPSASYGVSVLPTGAGTMSGYAWSSNIGWITFNSVGCPTTGCTPGAYADWAHPNSDGSVNIKGWARACSVFASGCSGVLKDSSVLGTCDSSTTNIDKDPSCNWDGYIALDSVSGGGTGGSWGLKINTDQSVTGYAWGSYVIGWIHSINIMLNTTGPTVSITSKNAIDSTTSCTETTITVTANNIDGANSCSFAGTATGLTMVQQPDKSWVGSIIVSPPTTTTYTVNCTKGTRTATAQTTVQSTYFTSGSASSPSSLTCNESNCSETNSCGDNNPPTDPGSGTGGSGDPGLDNLYCANLNTNPSFAWDTDATSCSITQQGGKSVTNLAGTSQAEHGVANGGFYYYSPNLPLETTSSVYTLQCTGGSQPISTPVTVNACQKDFQVIPSLPAGITGNQNVVGVSQQLLPTTDGKNVTATFNVNIKPLNSFNSPVNLTIAWSGGSAAGDLVSTFVPITISPSGTSVLTVILPFTDAVSGDTYTGVITGVSGTLTHTADVYLTVGGATTITPIYKEF
jgi:hypothetical protein